MNCPIDRQPLHSLDIGGITYSTCQKCMGVWCKTPDSFKHITNVFSSGKFPETLIPWQSILPVPIQRKWEENIHPCPHDATPMAKFIFSGDSKIILDRCFRCEGVWVHGSEIVRLFEYLRPNPTLDRAGTALIEDIEESERWHKEVRGIPLRIKSGGLGVFVAYFFRDFLWNTLHRFSSRKLRERSTHTESDKHIS